MFLYSQIAYLYKRKDHDLMTGLCQHWVGFTLESLYSSFLFLPQRASVKEYVSIQKLMLALQKAESRNENDTRAPGGSIGKYCVYCSSPFCQQSAVILIRISRPTIHIFGLGYLRNCGRWPSLPTMPSLTLDWSPTNSNPSFFIFMFYGTNSFQPQQSLVMILHS